MSQPSFDPDFTDAGFDDGLTPVESAFEPTPEPGPPVVSGPVYRKQGFSIYTVMLILSFVFLLTAMIFLFVEAGRYQ